MISDKTIQHCISMGTDKNGYTLCRACPESIRAQCIKPCVFSADGIKDQAIRVNRAVEDHYGGGES